MPDDDLVSVVVPMFNAGSTVLKTLDTIRWQTYPAIEIICVDDGSTDDTAEIVSRLDDPRITVIRQANAGCGGARNTGIRAARGKWLTFVDSDDAISPNMVELLINAAKSDETIDIVDCFHSIIRTDGSVLSTRDTLIDSDDPNYFAKVMSGRAPSMATAKLFRATLFEDPDRLFPTSTIHEDIYAVYKHFFAARRAITVPEVLYFWNFRQGSLSRNSSQKHVNDTLGAFCDSLSFLERNGIYVEYQDDFYRRCAHFTLGIFTKIEKFTSGETQEDTLAYLKQQLNVSPFFSEKMVSSLQRCDPTLLAALSKYHSPWAMPRRTTTSPAAMARPIQKPAARGIDPYYYVTFSGLILMAAKKLRRRLARP